MRSDQRGERTVRPFLDDARRHFQRLGRDQGLTALSVEPRVSVLIHSAEVLELVVRIAVPVRKKGRIEQAVLRSIVASLLARCARQRETPPLTPTESSSAVGRNAA